MSRTFTFTDTSSVLSSDYFPPVELKTGVECEVGLLLFDSYNSVPNVDETNQYFHYDEPSRSIKIDKGAYEVKDIEEFIKAKLKRASEIAGKNYFLSIKTNNNTLTSTVKANFLMDFTKENSIGKLLGSPSIVIQPNTLTKGSVVDVFKVNSIRIDCSIASGSYLC